MKTETKMIGEALSPVLAGIENAIWDFEANVELPPKFTEEGFRASIKIFMSAALDKMWTLQRNEKMNISDRAAMAQKMGEDLRQLVKTYTDVDTHTLYR